MVNNISHGQAASDRMGKRPLAVAAALLLLALIGGGGWLLANTQILNFNQPPALTTAEFEAETGFQVSLIAVTGGGGFVDFRIKVVDPEKATRFFSNPDHVPTLIIDDANVTLLPPSDFEFDIEYEARGYFLLFPNPQNAVAPGTPVTVAVGDLRLEPISAQ